MEWKMTEREKIEEIKEKKNVERRGKTENRIKSICTAAQHKADEFITKSLFLHNTEAKLQTSDFACIWNTMAWIVNILCFTCYSSSVLAYTQANMRALFVVLMGSSIYLFFFLYCSLLFIFHLFFIILLLLFAITDDFRVFIHLYGACHLFLFFISLDRFVVHFQWQMSKFDFFIKWRDPNKALQKNCTCLAAKFRFEPLVWHTICFDILWALLSRKIEKNERNINKPKRIRIH